MPDVYNGAPSNVTLFLMTVQKFIIWVVLFEFVNFYMPKEFVNSLVYFFFILILSNLFFGIFPALYQTKYKKLLIYSSIGANSLLFLPFLTGNSSAFVVYLCVYILNIFGLFLF